MYMQSDKTSVSSSDYNIYYGASTSIARTDAAEQTFAQWQAQNSDDVNSFESDPKLVNAGGTTVADFTF